MLAHGLAAVAGFGIGVALADMGFPYTTLEFWIVVGLAGLLHASGRMARPKS